MLVFLDEVMKDFWLDRPALCHTHTLLFKQKSTLHFCKWLHVSQTAAAKKNLYQCFLSTSQLAPSRHGCVYCVCICEHECTVCYDLSCSFMHTLCGCRHVLLLATTGSYLGLIFFLFPLTFPFCILKSGIYIHPVPWFYENIHKV